MIYLYLKTHNITGLKYLGKTTQDPYRYAGSGLIWKRHLKKYGNDVSTFILHSCEDPIEFRKAAKLISSNLNVVESTEFANLCHEEGQGGNTWCKKGITPKIDYKKLSENHRGGSHHKSKSVMIYGEIFGSVREASEKLKIHHTTISYRCRSSGFPEYLFIS